MMTKDSPQATSTGTKHPVYIFCSSVILLAAGLIVYIWLQPWAYRVTTDHLGMAFLPTVYLAIAGLASVLRLLAELRKDEVPSQQTVSAETAASVCPAWPIALMAGLILAATAVIWMVDPIVMCSGLVLILTLFAGIRDWRLLVGLSVGNLVLCWVLFQVLAGVFFPTSWLPQLYL